MKKNYLLMLIVFLFTGCTLLEKIEPTKVENNFILSSPENKYYKTVPQLIFSENYADTVEIYLNNKKTEAFNGYEITNSVTGINKLTVKAVKSGKEIIRSVEYFYNGLDTIKSDNFDSLDNSNSVVLDNICYTGIKSNMYSFFPNCQYTFKSECFINLFELESTSEFIQEFEIHNFITPDNNERSFITGNCDVYGGIIRSPEETFKLAFYKYGSNQESQISYTLISKSDEFKIDTTKHHKLIYYKNFSEYYILSIDSEDKILKMYSITDNSNKNNPIMTIRLYPNTYFRSNVTIVQIDNYLFYQ